MIELSLREVNLHSKLIASVAIMRGKERPMNGAVHLNGVNFTLTWCARGREKERGRKNIYYALRALPSKVFSRANIIHVHVCTVLSSVFSVVSSMFCAVYMCTHTHTH